MSAVDFPVVDDDALKAVVVAWGGVDVDGQLEDLPLLLGDVSVVGFGEGGVEEDALEVEDEGRAHLAVVLFEDGAVVALAEAFEVDDEVLGGLEDGVALVGSALLAAGGAVPLVALRQQLLLAELLVETALNRHLFLIEVVPPTPFVFDFYVFVQFVHDEVVQFRIFVLSAAVEFLELYPNFTTGYVRLLDD